MGLMSRLMGREGSDATRAFWRIAPIRSTDASVVHQFAMQALARHDGRDMVAAGWTIWRLAGIEAHQASNLLSDGFDFWRGDRPAEEALQRAYLQDVFEQLDEHDPPVAADPWSMPPERADAASAHYGTRAWAGWTLVEMLPSSSPERADWQERVLDAIARSPRIFVPFGPAHWADAQTASA